MSTIAIVQARTGSSRLPGKILKELDGRTVIATVYERLCQAKGLDGIVIAMPEGKSDDALAGHVQSFCRQIYRGSENDVLARFAGAATFFPADNYVRITSDCPFIDPDILDAMLIKYNSKKPDYMTNTLEPHLPRGLDVEIFTSDALRTAADEASLPYMREHVTPFLYQNGSRFKIAGYRHTDADHSHLRWTLDTAEDWTLIKRMSSLIGTNLLDARLTDFLSLYEDYPDLLHINAGIKQKDLIE